MSSEIAYVATFTFNGEVPADWLGALSEPVPPSSWIDPMSPGNLALEDIINKAAIVDPDSPKGAEILKQITANSPVAIDTLLSRKSISVKLPQQAVPLTALLGVNVVADATLLLAAGCEKAKTLATVTLKMSTLLSSGITINNEQKAERMMYFMTPNGICVEADSTITLSADKLPGATFFTSADEMDIAGVERWGENGWDGWRTHAFALHGRGVLNNSLGHMVYLGNEPEVTIMSVSE